MGNSVLLRKDRLSTAASSQQITPGAHDAEAIKPHAAHILVRSTISVDLRKAYRKTFLCAKAACLCFCFHGEISRIRESHLCLSYRQEGAISVSLAGIEGSDDRGADRSSKIAPTATI